MHGLILWISRYIHMSRMMHVYRGLRLNMSTGVYFDWQRFDPA